MGKTIRELLNEAKLAGHKSITREEVLEEKAAIEQGFVALGLTVEEGLRRWWRRRVCAHEYYHDGGPLDLLAERHIKNQAWLRVMNETVADE